MNQSITAEYLAYIDVNGCVKVLPREEVNTILEEGQIRSSIIPFILSDIGTAVDAEGAVREIPDSPRKHCPSGGKYAN